MTRTLTPCARERAAAAQERRYARMDAGVDKQLAAFLRRAKRTKKEKAR